MGKENYRDYDLSAAKIEKETDPGTLALLEAHEREEEGAGEMRVNIRWHRDQVNLIKRAAALMDVPYQVYIKQLVMRQAISDIQAAEVALAASRRPGPA
jgi:predicted DNA binding CopG/RHH family protein